MKQTNKKNKPELSVKYNASDFRDIIAHEEGLNKRTYIRIGYQP